MLPGATPQSRPPASRVVHVSNAHVSGGVYRDRRRSTWSRRRAALVHSVSARASRISRQSAGLVKRGLRRPAGDGSPGRAAASDGGSSGSGSAAYSISGAEGSATGCPVAGSGASGRAADSCSRGWATGSVTILMTRMREGASDDVGRPGKSGTGPACRPVSADGTVTTERTNAWIAIDAAIEATSSRRLSLRRASTLARSDVPVVTACRSSPGTMLAPGRDPAGCLTPSVGCDSPCREEVARLPRHGDAIPAVAPPVSLVKPHAVTYRLSNPSVECCKSQNATLCCIFDFATLCRGVLITKGNRPLGGAGGAGPGYGQPTLLRVQTCAFSSARRTGCRSRPRSPGAG